MFSQSLCRICERAGDWRYKEEREEEYFSLLFTDLPVEWIPKKKPQLNNFSSVPLQLAVTTDDYKETYAIKQPLKPVLKAQTRKDTCAYGCPTITFSSINSVKNVLPQGNSYRTGEGDSAPLHTVNGEKERGNASRGEGRAVFTCALVAEQETHQP